MKNKTTLIDTLHDILGRELSTLILISSSPSLSLTVQQRLPVLVQPQLGNDNLGWVNPNVDGRTINFLAGDALDVDYPFATVDLNNFPFPAFVSPTNQLDLVVLAHRHGPDVVLGPQIG